MVPTLDHPSDDLTHNAHVGQRGAYHLFLPALPAGRAQPIPLLDDTRRKDLGRVVGSAVGVVSALCSTWVLIRSYHPRGVCMGLLLTSRE